MRLGLAVVSLLVLIGSGVVVYEQSRSRWQDDQKAYLNQAMAMAKSPAERSALEGRTPKLEQTIVTAFGEARVDRCQSCHIAVDDPRFDSSREPLRTHPYSAAMGDVFKNGRWERRHKFSEFGCTSCHDGQGRGLTIEDAHGDDLSWPGPMLGYTVQTDWKKEFAAHLRDKDFIQANCAHCHADKNFAGTPLMARGRELFFKTGCFGCHRIEGLSSGTLGVDLTEVGKERKLDYLWGHIVNPRAYTPASIMPQFKLSDEERKALVIFLKSRQGVNYDRSAVANYKLQASTGKPVPESAAAVEAKIASGATSAERGEQLIEGYACLSCHRLGDRDGGISPDLSYEGLVRDQAWLMDHFRAPRSRVPDSNMPAFGLPDADYQDMTAYLLARTTRPAAMSAAETYKALCARCHDENGDGKGVNAIYLDPAPRDLTRAEFMNSKPEARLIDSITNGVPGTSMPDWGKALNDDQVKGVLAYIEQSFVKKPRIERKPRKLPEQNPVAVSTGSISRGEAIFLQRCTGCHGRKADGHGPNSVDISPRPRNLRNAAFIGNVSDRRLFEAITYGVEGTAMPSWIDYGLSQNDVGDIVNYIRSLNSSEMRSDTPGGVNGNTSTGGSASGR
jgi:mono/diheme cytochrome c family protein